MIRNRASLPALPEEENVALLIKAKEGDQYAKELFFAHNERFIWHVARKFSNTRVDENELFSLCSIGFIKAFNTYDLDKGVKFATYSGRVMHNEVLMHLRNIKKHFLEVGLDDTMSVDESGNSLTLADVLGVEDNHNERADLEHIKQVFEIFRERAKERDYEVMRLSIIEGLNQKEIADRVNITQSYVSRMLLRLTEDLKKISYELLSGRKRTTSAERSKRREQKSMRHNVGKLKWVFENTNLPSSAIAEFFGVSDASVLHYRRLIHTKYASVEADASIAPEIHAFIEQRGGERIQPGRKSKQKTEAPRDTVRWSDTSEKEQKESVEAKKDWKEEQVKTDVPNESNTQKPDVRVTPSRISLRLEKADPRTVMRSAVYAMSLMDKSKVYDLSITLDANA